MDERAGQGTGENERQNAQNGGGFTSKTGTATVYQGRLIFSDEADAIEYWKDKDWKKWAVDVIAGPAKRPTFSSTVYVGARTAERAIICAKENALSKPPRGSRYIARLAGPRELGCIPTPPRRSL